MSHDGSQIHRVDVSLAGRELDDLTTEVGDGVHVVRAGIGQDHRDDTPVRQHGDPPVHHGGLSQPRLAEDECRGIGDNPGPKPRHWVRADEGASAQVIAQRCADHRQPGPGRERVKPTHLDRGSLQLEGGLDDVHRSSAGPVPAARAGPVPGGLAGLAPALTGLGAVPRCGALTLGVLAFEPGQVLLGQRQRGSDERIRGRLEIGHQKNSLRVSGMSM
ncbi:hypothetical protein ACFFX0_32665 [Citricoccus parietis]|uniref:Uncharacterized protein n=1 Tax=Citricoccus parietis TaxID=592307 RepID=A0ABV5GAM7_9MICC